MQQLTASPIGVELLDDRSAPDAAVTRSLREIATANRFLGGHSTMIGGLTRVLGKRRGAFSLLDVGTGAGDMPLAAIRWGATRDVRLHPLGIELHRAAAALAASNGVTTAVASGGNLPLADNSVDIVMCSQLLHHFDDHSCVHLLREMRRVARLGGIVVDLRNRPLSGSAFRLFGAAMGFDPVTVGDGIVSLSRGRPATQLARLAGAAQLPDHRASHHAIARVLLTWREAA